MSNLEFRYRAFISYSHRDERWATWLHRALERYHVPRRLVGRVTPAGAVPKRIAPVFRDREELPSATDLGRTVNAALEQSAALIIVCSPAAAQSRWVNAEIRAFQKLGRTERIFCLIVDGDPGGVVAPQCFPDALLTRGSDGGDDGPVEPIGADVRPGKDRRTAALLKLIAGILSVGLDELVRRDLQRRNRRLVATSVAAVAGMGVASVLATLALLARNEAQEQRTRAEIEATTARQTSEFLVQLFQVADPSEARGNTITAREILDRGAARVDGDLAAQPVVRANLMRTMGRVYTGLGLYEQATDLLERALAVRKEIGTAPTPETVATANALGEALFEKGEYEAAEAVYTDALRAAQALYPDGDAAVTRALSGIGDVRTRLDDYTGAEARFVDALAMDRRLHADANPDVARSLAGLALALLYQERFSESEAAFREALDIRKRTLGSDHPLVAQTLSDLGLALNLSGRAREAEPLTREAADIYRRILGNDHPFVSSLLNNLARLELERGELVDAEKLLNESLAIDRKRMDPDHADLVYSLNNLGLVQLGLGQDDAALPLLDEALRIGNIHQHRMLGQVYSNLAEAYRRVGRPTDALAAVEAARPLLTALYPNDPWYLANVASIEGAVRGAGSDLETAERLLLDSYAVIEKRWGAEGLFTQLAAGRAAEFYEARGNVELANRYERLASGR
jgi:tetratricopeptide (TPR) repeat protein